MIELKEVVLNNIVQEPLEKQLEDYFDRLWPINRSITGNGVRQSLDILKEIIDLETYEIPTGTKVFDWTIPKEWNVKEAYVINPDGERILDFSENNLHLLGYSMPVSKKVSLSELKEHLYTLEDQPSAIPYVTSYYKERWGFCISYNEYKLLREGTYEVVVDAELKDGHLTYADCILPGKTPQEILISTYLCHPSMANNELSGPLVAAFLYKALKEMGQLYYTYRFVYVPETIGAISYLHKNGEKMKQQTHAGLVVTCAGDPHAFTYKKSKDGNTITDRTALHILKFHAKDYHSAVDFFPMGSDERQYCSPGFNLPVGSLMRTMYGIYDEYHTSLDNKDFISFAALKETIEMYLRIIEALEINQYYINTAPNGEPQLGKRGLYPDISTKESKEYKLKKMLYILSYSDGKYSLLDIADKLNCSILALKEELFKLIDAGLIKLSAGNVL